MKTTKTLREGKRGRREERTIFVKRRNVWSLTSKAADRGNFELEIL